MCFEITGLCNYLETSWIVLLEYCSRSIEKTGELKKTPRIEIHHKKIKLVLTYKIYHAMVNVIVELTQL